MHSKTNLLIRLSVGWLLIVSSITIATLLSWSVASSFFLPEQQRQLIAGIFTTVFVLTGLRGLLGKRKLSSIGIGSIRIGIVPLFQAAATLLLTVLIFLGMGILFGGVTFDGIQVSSSIIGTIVFTLITAFLFEAFPEEVILRGYIFTVLRERMRLRWVIVFQSILFVALGVAVRLLFDAAGIESNAMNIIDYSIFLFIFGIALGCARTAWNSVWAPIGFHLTWLLLNRYIFSVDNRLLDISYAIPGSDIVILLSILFISIITFSVLTKRHK